MWGEAAMLRILQLAKEWRRAREVIKMVWQAKGFEQGKFVLRYPDLPWYRTHAKAIMEILLSVATKLEQDSGLNLPDPTLCYVTTPEQAEIINKGAIGRTYHFAVTIGLHQNHLSTFAQTLAHELAHVLSLKLGNYETPFKGEGFACYLAASAGVDLMPMGLPVHYYPKWLISRGVSLRLGALWQRCDYSPELYDLAWSFTTFLAVQYGKERYFAFYADKSKDLNKRLIKFFGATALTLQEKWSEFVWENVDAQPEQIREMHRELGWVCSRALWLRQ